MKNPKSKIKKTKQTKYAISYSGIYLFIAFAVAVLLGTNLKLILPKPGSANTSSSIEVAAKKIDDLCKNNLTNDRCYANAFYALSQKNDSKYAVATLMGIQQIDPQHTTGCHFIAHKISQAETEKDPKNWEKIIQKMSPSMCTGGFLHGVLEAHLATDQSFKIDEKTITYICAKLLNGSQNQFGERSCSHNLGHLMLIQEDGNIHSAVENCDKLVNASYHYECLSGSFMERETAENLLAHGLIKTRPIWNEKFANSIEGLCSEFSGLATKACWKELSYVYFAMSNSEPKGLYAECQRAPTKDIQDECYIYGAGNMVTGSNFKNSNLIVLCHQFDISDPLFSRCINQTLGALITSSPNNIGKTMSVCGKTYEIFKQNCYSRIIYFLTLNKAPRNIISSTCSQIPTSMKTQICRG